MNAVLGPVFLLKLLITFLTAGTWVTASTLIAERFGPRIGGVVGGMPATIVVALFFLGWTQSAQAAADSTLLVPVIIGISGPFIVTYVWLSPRGFAGAVAAGMVVWFALAVAVVHFGMPNFVDSIAADVVLIVLSYIVLDGLLGTRVVPAASFHPTPAAIALRASLSGTIVAVAIVLGKLSGPLWGGAFAAFPVGFLATILIAHTAQGALFTRGLMKVLMVSGTTNVVVYASLVRLLYPRIGLAGGTALAFVLSLGSVYTMLRLARRMA